MTEQAPAGPLTGLRVLELGSFIAAPTAGRLLADFGAEVVKVERPGGGDELRRWRLYGGDTSLLFRALNRNKRSVGVDLKSAAGRDLALRLVERSDVVLENFRPGTLERWGLGPEELHAVNPTVVLVRISGYGQSGPYRDRPGFGGVAEAVGGLRNLTGYPDRPPTRVGVSLADSVAALYAVIGALMALRRPHGEVVDVALYEGIYSLMESLVPDYEVFDVHPERSGSSLPGVVPSNTYRCADGKFAVVSGNGDAIFRRLMRLVGRADLAADPAPRSAPGRPPIRWTRCWSSWTWRTCRPGRSTRRPTSRRIRITRRAACSSGIPCTTRTRTSRASCRSCPGSPAGPAGSAPSWARTPTTSVPRSASTPTAAPSSAPPG
jgi:crotonobetainyl-CoA:carnitine CoA-transferase CaiB-like acyl-CoA transferase